MDNNVLLLSDRQLIRDHFLASLFTVQQLMSKRKYAVCSEGENFVRRFISTINCPPPFSIFDHFHISEKKYPLLIIALHVEAFFFDWTVIIALLTSG
ncbi:hypothetical protein T08_873 [Trichinella sp. T8]|nr:hypothetical protein T08_873 [Trichinella sp. T8]